MAKDNKQNFWDLGSSEDENVSLVKGSGVSQSDAPIGEAIDDALSDTDLSVSDETGLEVSGFAHLDQVLDDLPQDVVENLPMIGNRIDAYVAYYSARNLTRLPKLFNFIHAAEDVMFNPEDLLHMDFDQVQTVYKYAKGSVNETLELARRVAQTMRQEKDRRVDALYDLLTGLSPDTIERMLEMAEAAQEDDTD